MVQGGILGTVSIHTTGITSIDIMVKVTIGIMAIVDMMPGMVMAMAVMMVVGAIGIMIICVVAVIMAVMMVAGAIGIMVI